MGSRLRGDGQLGDGMRKIRAPRDPAKLIDGEQRHRESPNTFEIPPVIVRRNANVGDLVKIGFESPETLGERFWVEIVERTAEARYVGRVDNGLDEAWGVDYNDFVAFEPRHILATE